MTSTTISLPQNYQMPDTATAMQAAGYQQQAVQSDTANVARQHATTATTYAGTHCLRSDAPVNVQQQLANGQTYMGNQLPQQPQMATAAPTAYPGMQAIAQTPVGGAPPAGQIQQQSYQQPMIQHPMMQPPPIRQAQQTMQTWPQAQCQLSPGLLR